LLNSFAVVGEWTGIASALWQEVAETGRAPLANRVPFMCAFSWDAFSDPPRLTWNVIRGDKGVSLCGLDFTHSNPSPNPLVANDRFPAVRSLELELPTPPPAPASARNIPVQLAPRSPKQPNEIQRPKPTPTPQADAVAEKPAPRPRKRRKLSPTAVGWHFERLMELGPWTLARRDVEPLHFAWLDMARKLNMEMHFHRRKISPAFRTRPRKVVTCFGFRRSSRTYAVPCRNLQFHDRSGFGGTSSFEGELVWDLHSGCSTFMQLLRDDISSSAGARALPPLLCNFTLHADLTQQRPIVFWSVVPTTSWSAPLMGLALEPEKGVALEQDMEMSAGPAPGVAGTVSDPDIPSDGSDGKGQEWLDELVAADRAGEALRVLGEPSFDGIFAELV